MDLGENIRKLRKEKGLTQEYLAEQLHVSRQAVSKWERGSASPSMDNLIALSRLLEAPLEQLAGSAASPALPPPVAEGRPSKWLRRLLLLAACAALLLAAGCLRLLARQHARAVPSSSAASGAVYEPLSDFVLGEAACELMDGRSAFVRLILTEGEFFTDEYENYIPGGGAYAANYQGSYRLEVRDSAQKLLCTYALNEDFGGGAMNFPGEVSLSLFDYNRDGRPEFTIGQYGSSSALLYALYTLNGEGGIEKICPELIADSRDISCFSVTFPRGEGEEGKGFRASQWNNAAGAPEERPYRWDAASRQFLPAG